MTGKRRILFIGEAVSLAHVSRPLVLAQALDPRSYDIHFACDQRYESLVAGNARHPLLAHSECVERGLHPGRRPRGVRAGPQGH